MTNVVKELTTNNVFSVFGNVKSKNPVGEATINDLFSDGYSEAAFNIAEQIAAGTLEKNRALCMTPSVLLKKRGQKETSRTTWMVVDIDHYKGKEELPLYDMLEGLRSFKYLYGARISVSGKGIFAVARVDAGCDFKSTFSNLVKDLVAHGIPESMIDNLADLPRLRFWSSGEYWVNEDCETFKSKVVAFNPIDGFFKTYISEDGLYHHDDFMSMMAKSLYQGFSKSGIVEWCEDNSRWFSDSLSKEWGRHLSFVFKDIKDAKEFKGSDAELLSDIDIDIPKFPIEVFPENLQKYILNQCDTKYLDEAFVSAGVMAAISTAMGGKFQTDMWGRKGMPHNFYCIAGVSGSNKTGALDAGIVPIQNLDDQERVEYSMKIQVYKAATKEQRKKMDIPHRRHYVIHDSTLEGIVTAHQYNNNGFMWMSQEVDTIIKGLDKYSKGTDTGNYSKLVDMWGGGALKVLRAREEDNKEIDRVRITIVGGTQLDRLNQIFSHDGSGMIDRWLFFLSKRDEYRFKLVRPDVDMEAEYTKAVTTIASHVDGRFLVQVEGLQLYAEWVDKKMAEPRNKIETQRLKKLFIHSGRILLNLHMIRQAYAGKSLILMMSKQTVKDMIKLLEYFDLTRDIVDYHLQIMKNRTVDVDSIREQRNVKNMSKAEKIVHCHTLHSRQYTVTLMAKIFNVSRPTIYTWIKSDV